MGAIVFPELNFCKKLIGLTEDIDLEKIISTPSVLEALQTVLNTFDQQNTGNSTLIKRAVFAHFTLSIDKREITDKGSINQRQILANRREYVEMIYEKRHLNGVLEVQK